MENLKNFIIESMESSFYAQVCTEEDNFILTCQNICRETDYHDAMSLCLDCYTELLGWDLYMKDVEYI